MTKLRLFPKDENRPTRENDFVDAHGDITIVDNGAFPDPDAETPPRNEFEDQLTWDQVLSILKKAKMLGELAENYRLKYTDDREKFEKYGPDLMKVFDRAKYIKGADIAKYLDTKPRADVNKFVNTHKVIGVLPTNSRDVQVLKSSLVEYIYSDPNPKEIVIDGQKMGKVALLFNATPYVKEGETKYAEPTPALDDGDGLDPVGQEDDDINNDGEIDDQDSYLKHRRKVRSKIINKERSEK